MSLSAGVRRRRRVMAVLLSAGTVVAGVTGCTTPVDSSTADDGDAAADRHAFEVHDRDGDDRLSPLELEQAGLGEQWHVFDRDGSGAVSFPEFRRGLADPEVRQRGDEVRR
ncbi:hypothetical protein C7446_2667 [Kushneria sinocarnis]|uniref:EF-hand domain-containing protein n=1 Tax=Kushneria sinocarnis TaxID=595502 RepID=A0A420WUY4_9GAMM|nr:EF-hand domain-containing protein [Kushneria sinocarnis]RKQ97244.1 hypothetical protein C7446_2667 [Kushneria sinocarnis]